MAGNKLNKDGLNKVWLKVMELVKSLTGNVDRTKGTLQEQVNELNSNLDNKANEFADFSNNLGIINGTPWIENVSLSSDGAVCNVASLSLQAGVYIILGFISCTDTIFDKIYLLKDNTIINTVTPLQELNSTSPIIYFLKIDNEAIIHVATRTWSENAKASGGLSTIKLK